MSATFSLFDLYMKYREVPYEDEASMSAFRDLIEYLKKYPQLEEARRRGNCVTQRQCCVISNAIQRLFMGDYKQAFQEVVNFFQNCMDFEHTMSYNEYALLNSVLLVFSNLVKE